MGVSAYRIFMGILSKNLQKMLFCMANTDVVLTDEPCYTGDHSQADPIHTQDSSL